MMTEVLPSAGAVRPRPVAERTRILDRLGGRSVVLVGMMGAGKTAVGRRLAQRLDMPFVDADAEIEAAARLTVAEIFERHGEAAFREGEARVVGRLLAAGQHVVATGGGAFLRPETRRLIALHGVSIWLRADVDVLIRRVRRRQNRPLLVQADLDGTVKRISEERASIYGLADMIVESNDAPAENVVDAVLAALDGPGPMRTADREPAPLSRVSVDIADRPYDILIGARLAADAGRRLAALQSGARCAIVTDRNVARHHLGTVQASLTAAGLQHTTHIVEPGEASKSYDGFAGVCDALLEARLERRDLVVALGGGVVGDLAGFAAATVKRGLRYVQIPTTLLAQVDSSVGGKTAINTSAGKNLVGAFHQPSLVLAEPELLQTLPAREFRAGYAEVVKYGLINDASFFEWLEKNRVAIFAFGPALAEAVRCCCLNKAGVVSRDETEQGERALLNLGHTFGHAFERLTQYDGSRLVHGEAVAIGLACAFRFSVQLGHCPPADAERVARHLQTAGLPTRIGAIAGFNADAEAVLDAMRQDKKVERGALTFILARGIGASFIAKDVPAETVRAFLDDELTRF